MDQWVWPAAGAVEDLGTGPQGCQSIEPGEGHC